jgi:hypothetical protein
MLVIDPSSGGTSRKGEKSLAGWAYFESGVLVESGVIEYPTEKIVFKRLKNVYEYWKKSLLKYDIFVIEDIRGYRAQQSLIQACGVYIATIPFDEFFQVNVKTWKSIATKWGGYVKSDENDAVYMGYATVAIALGYHSKLKVEEKETIIEKAKEVVGYE